MTKSTRIQVRMAPELKEKGEKLFESMGLNMSSAVNLFVEHSLRTGGLPFVVGQNNLNASSMIYQNQND